jgi:hypothetical protein
MNKVGCVNKLLVMFLVSSNAFARADFVVLYPRTPVLPRTLQRVTTPVVIEKKEPVIGPILVVQSGRCFVVSDDSAKFSLLVQQR